jgi:hypothetical protein
MHLMVLVDDKVHVEAPFGRFRDSGNLTQDRCTVHAKHNIVSKINLDAADGTAR